MEFRFSRQIALPEVGLEGQARLERARVLCVGIGGLGAPAATYLAAAGVGTIGLCDSDRVEASNLPRQVLYPMADVGRPKAAVARERLADLVPGAELIAIEARLDAGNALSMLQGYDCVIDGTDNLATRYVINDACRELRIPWVYASLFRWEGQVSVFAPGQACYRCLYPNPPARDPRNCSEAGVLGPVAGVLATLQATEALKLLLGLEGALQGRCLTLDARTMRFEEFSVPRREACRHGPRGALDPLAPEYAQAGECSLGVSLAEFLSRPGAFDVIDVRTVAERATQGAWEGDRSIPLAELEGRLGELDPERDIVFYCAAGRRSAAAAELVRRRGLPRVRGLECGYEQLVTAAARLRP